MVSFAVDSLAIDSLEALPLDFIHPPTSFAEPPYNGRRSAVVIGLAGELIELIESP